MSLIQLLPDSVINQIAAGEVIERPASAVKELVENSLDAGATQIKILVKRGGKDLIKITDNGAGIEPEDIEKSVMRHATSKLRDASDLFKLTTNGFRGEALSSIASISKLTIETRCRGVASNALANVETGFRAEFEAGILKSKEEAALPIGTTISVSDLFFNAPVRAEFLKNDSIENSRILDAVTRLSIANEHVRFEYKADNRLLFCSAEGNLEARISDVLGASVMRGLREVAWEESGIKVSGFVSSAESLQSGKRNIPYIYLQKRPIYNAMINKAINQAYSPYGDYSPVAILFLEMPLETFDVNVHPAKKEVRFSRDNAVFLAVSHALHNTLQNAVSYPTVSIVGALRENAPAYVAGVADNNADRLVVSGKWLVEKQAQELFPDNSILPFEPPLTTSHLPLANSQTYLQLAQSYIVCEQGNSMLIIDQHRAHKRIVFERTLAALQREETLSSQELLFPETFEIPAYLAPILEEQKTNLKKMGFYIEPFGFNSWQLRGIPPHLPIKAAGKAVFKYLEDINQSKESDIFKKNALAFANSTAIQSETELSQQEMQTIVLDLLSLENPYETPKGEAIFMKMPVEDIKRKF